MIDPVYSTEKRQNDLTDVPIVHRRCKSDWSLPDHDSKDHKHIASWLASKRGFDHNVSRAFAATDSRAHASHKKVSSSEVTGPGAMSASCNRLEMF